MCFWDKLCYWLGQIGLQCKCLDFVKDISRKFSPTLSGVLSQGQLCTQHPHKNMENVFRFAPWIYRALFQALFENIFFYSPLSLAYYLVSIYPIIWDTPNCNCLQGDSVSPTACISGVLDLGCHLRSLWWHQCCPGAMPGSIGAFLLVPMSHEDDIIIL